MYYTPSARSVSGRKRVVSAWLVACAGHGLPSGGRNSRGDAAQQSRWRLPGAAHDGCHQSATSLLVQCAVVVTSVGAERATPALARVELAHALDRLALDWRGGGKLAGVLARGLRAFRGDSSPGAEHGEAREPTRDRRVVLEQ